VKLLQKRQKQKGGFTLIELVVYVAIFAIVGTLGGTVLDFALKSKSSTNRSNEVFFGTERAMTQIVQHIHGASSVTTASGSTLVIQESGASTIISLQSNGIVIKEGTNTTTTVTPSSLFVETLSFTSSTNTLVNNDFTAQNASVQISITAGYNDGGVIDAGTRYTLQTTALPL
jgi:prepilin-type N-terminal cleavage/methylation domain-containing protein